MKYYNNHLGVKGWLYGGNYSVERYLYTLHRISGLGLILYLLLHIWVTAARIYGASAWEATMAFLSAPIFKFGEYLLMVGAIFHATNGLRLLLIELGIGIGRPQRQEYPYTPSVKKQRPLMLALMLVAAVLIIISGLDFFIV